LGGRLDNLESWRRVASADPLITVDTEIVTYREVAAKARIIVAASPSQSTQ
jgi:hypothetical protein